MLQDLSSPRRQFIMDSTLMKVCRKSVKPRKFFLFNDILVYGSILSKRRFSGQSILPLTYLSIVSLPDDPPGQGARHTARSKDGMCGRGEAKTACAGGANQGRHVRAGRSKDDVCGRGDGSGMRGRSRTWRFGLTLTLCSHPFQTLVPARCPRSRLQSCCTHPPDLVNAFQVFGQKKSFVVMTATAEEKALWIEKLTYYANQAIAEEASHGT